MFLTPQQIAQTRDHTLSNLLELSAACFEAGQRLSDLLAASSREALHQGSKHFALFGHGQVDALTHFPATLWLDGSTRQSRLLDSACTILGEAHKALIQSTETQVRVFDSVVFTSLNRLARSSPWEAEIALKAMRTVLENSEQSLHEISTAAVDTVDIAGQEVHQITESLTAKKAPRQSPTPRPRARKV